MSQRTQRTDQPLRNLDWTTVFIYLIMVTLGWMNIYAAVLDAPTGTDDAVQQSIFDLGLNSGKQLLWIGTSLFLALMIMVIDYKFYETFAYVIYGLVIVSLLGVLAIGSVVAGSKSWFEIGSFRVQPAEFAKFATALALARYIGLPTVRLDRRNYQMAVAAIIGFPALLIILQNDTGSMLVFSCFIIVLFREGLPGVYPGLGLSMIAVFVLTLLMPKYWLMGGMAVLAGVFIMLIPKRLSNILKVVGGLAVVCSIIFGVDFFVTDVLQPHQQDRIKALIDPGADPLGFGWNVTQSKIAIGSGGFIGKGWQEGTQTKFDFVPEQSTDFIFCTIGEEHGWLGSLIIIGLFIWLMYRVIFIAERQKSRFARVYGYSVASVFFFHFTINIGMTIGLFPVIGIPLPFFSYGGSSLWSFTVLLFILLKLDSHRSQLLNRRV
ncbi:MAG: rod shape-determining protein RodA [Bacteroidota bacterium]